MNKNVLRIIINIAAFLLTITVNALASLLPLNGVTTGEVSDSFPIFFVPAGYVFSIWGLIYLGLLGFIIYQALPAQRENPRLRAISPWFVLNNLANSAWIFLWHYGYFGWTMVAMLVVLITLIAIYILLRRDGATTLGEKWFVQAPFSLYLGWISVATIANASTTLFDAGWNAWGIAPEVWTVIMLAVSVVLTGLMLFLRSDLIFSLVIIWALIGIALKHADTMLVSGGAWVSTGAVVALVFVSIVRKLAGRRMKAQ